MGRRATITYRPRKKRSGGFAMKNQVNLIVDLSLKDQPECEDPASKVNNVSTEVAKELTNVTSLENKTFENVKSPRRSLRIQNAVSFSQDQAIETVVQNIEASETDEEDQQCVAQEKKGPETILCARSIEEKVDQLFLLMEEQQKTIEALVSKSADKSLPSQNPCEAAVKLEMKLNKYKNMYLDSQKKIEDLQEENFELTKKLECAYAELEVAIVAGHVPLNSSTEAKTQAAKRRKVLIKGEASSRVVKERKTQTT